VRSDPKGSEVFLDGEPQPAATPTTIEQVPAGFHTIRVELEGYVAADTTVVVAGSEIAEVELNLAAAEDGAPTPFWKKRWVQLTAGGVLGAGLIAALAGGGGGDGGDPEGEELPWYPDPPHQ